MADRDVETRAGVGASLDATNYDQTIKSLDGTVEEQTGATYEVVYTDQNKTIELNHATMTCTLDAIADIAALIDTDQFKVTLRNTNAATATVQRSSTDTIEDGSATSITLMQYETVTLQFDSGGSNWNIIHTGRVISSATISEILDANGNEMLEFGVEASAANNIKVWNKAGAAYPRISAEGAADTGIVFLDSNGNRLFLMDTVDTNADNYVYTNNNAGAVTVGAQGADTNIDLTLSPKGSGVVDLTAGVTFAAGEIEAADIATDAVTQAKVAADAVRFASEIEGDGTDNTIVSFSGATGNGLVPAGVWNIGQITNYNLFSAFVNIQLHDGTGWITLKQYSVNSSGSIGTPTQVVSDGANVRISWTSGSGTADLEGRRLFK